MSRKRKNHKIELSHVSDFIAKAQAFFFHKYISSFYSTLRLENGKSKSKSA
jgi:hypothetical protein